ncbi:PspC domain-containing protein [bacterium]|nr:PspC domain-containing protein [bacterium]
MDKNRPGTAIAERRRQKGLSQDDLAYLCKVDVRTIQRIESGAVKPRPATLKILCNTLGCNPEDLTREQNTHSASGEAGKSGNQANPGTDNRNVLQRLARSARDYKIAGICGGLGEYTPLPSWMWRLAFVLGLIAHGASVIAYALLWIFMPGPKIADDSENPFRSNWFRRLARSTRDRKLGGVCGGLGENTSAPAWCWRVLFIALTFCHGAGIILYVLAWIFLPKADPAVRTAAPSMA